MGTRSKNQKKRAQWYENEKTNHKPFHMNTSFNHSCKDNTIYSRFNRCVYKKTMWISITIEDFNGVIRQTPFYAVVVFSYQNSGSSSAWLHHSMLSKLILTLLNFFRLYTPEKCLYLNGEFDKNFFNYSTLSVLIQLSFGFRIFRCKEPTITKKESAFSVITKSTIRSFS